MTTRTDIYAAPALRSLSGWLRRSAILIVPSLLVFAYLAFSVITNGPLAQNDMPLELRVHQQALAGPKWLVVAAQFLSFMGKHGITTLAVAFGLYFLQRRQWRPLALMLAGLAASTVLFWITSGLIGRQRPVLPNPLEVIPFPGFPSGHMANATAFYGFLVYLLWPSLKDNLRRALFTLAMIVLVILVGWSRVYLGGHYLTDVLAGCALGLIVAALFYPWIDSIFARREAKRVQ
jgi:undecaprenyl-diphosphatase